MARGKGGRKRKPGERHDCGRLKAVHDYGNDRNIAFIAMFRPFQGGKADQWVTSAIGRAWAVHLLDGWDADPTAIRDAGLKYAGLYWSHYPSANAVANYEGQDRRGGGGGEWYDPDPQGDAFAALDDAIRAVGRAHRDAVHELVIDCHFTPHANPEWLDRLIFAKRLAEWTARPNKPEGATGPAGILPHLDGSDQRKLNLAIEGLLVVVAGKQRKVA